MKVCKMECNCCYASTFINFRLKEMQHICALTSLHFFRLQKLTITSACAKKNRVFYVALQSPAPLVARLLVMSWQRTPIYQRGYMRSMIHVHFRHLRRKATLTQGHLCVGSKTMLLLEYNYSSTYKHMYVLAWWQSVVSASSEWCALFVVLGLVYGVNYATDLVLWWKRETFRLSVER